MFSLLGTLCLLVFKLALDDCLRGPTSVGGQHEVARHHGLELGRSVMPNCSLGWGGGGNKESGGIQEGSFRCILRDLDGSIPARDVPGYFWALYILTVRSVTKRQEVRSSLQVGLPSKGVPVNLLRAAIMKDQG